MGRSEVEIGKIAPRPPFGATSGRYSKFGTQSPVGVLPARGTSHRPGML